MNASRHPQAITQAARDWSNVLRRLAAPTLLLALAAGSLRADPPEPAAQPPIEVRLDAFGRTADGRQVDCYTLTSPGRLRVRVMTLGATLLTVEAPDRDGKLDHVTLYLDTLDDYLRGHPLFGSVVGRYANRIAGAKFTLDGKQHAVEANAGEHHIHGGRNGFQKLVWDAQPIFVGRSAGVELSLTSPDGDAGFPGTLRATVVYRLTTDNELVMDYTATTDKPTVVNLTNHAYWNLAGAGSGDALGHELMLAADHYLPSDAQKIPTGEIRPVEGTPMDFREPKTIGSRIKQVEGENYDHCYVLRKEPGERMWLAARVVEPRSGRVMEVFTTKPGVQLYTARPLGDRLRGGGKPYGPYHGFCLETQHYPDAPNKPNFPSPVLRPGQAYRATTMHRFSTLEQTGR
jgi:aldose 1-epimerase